DRRQLQLDERTVMEEMRTADERMENLSERQFQALRQEAQEVRRQEAADGAVGYLQPGLPWCPWAGCSSVGSQS
ncbi:Hypothetical predicted protein, partial [Pelobates cultripes]